jgi:hypothetical protein
MKTRFFDFETFETWWCVTFGDHDLQDWSDYDKLGQDAFEEKAKNEMFTITSDDYEAQKKLSEIFNDEEICFSGYNIKHFDLVLVNAILKGYTPREVRMISDMIIDENLKESSVEHYRLSGFTKKKYNTNYYIDMFNRLNGSLKDFESLAGLDIEESGVDFDLKRPLTAEEKAEVIKYNKHDVYATMEYCRIMKQPTIDAKYSLAKTFNIPLEYTLKNTNAIASAKILGANKQSYADEEEEVIDLHPKIKEYVYKNVPIQIYNWLTTSKLKLEVECFGNKVVYGNGGIHSVMAECLYVEPKEDEVLFNMDAVSYYPSIMIQLDLMSRSVPPIARDKFIQIFNDRLAIKYKKDRTEQDELFSKAYKLVLNTTYGTMGDKFNPMYDLYRCSSVCRYGQLLLTALACRLEKLGVKIIQTNTDGILCLAKKTLWDAIQKEKKTWEDITGIGLDTDDVLRIWQRDVNNYIMEVQKKGKVKHKVKGGWFGGSYLDPSDDICGSLYAPVIKRAALEFLTKDIDPIVTLSNSRDLMDFTINCKKGPGFFAVYHKRNPHMGQDGNTEWDNIPMNRSNRIIAVKDPKMGKMVKVKRRLGQISENTIPECPDHCLPMNSKMTSYKWEDYKGQLDYEFYLGKIEETLDIVWKDYNGNIVTEFQWE